LFVSPAFAKPLLAAAMAAHFFFFLFSVPLLILSQASFVSVAS
jgi:hypothetical protein